MDIIIFCNMDIIICCTMDIIIYSAKWQFFDTAAARLSQRTIYLNVFHWSTDSALQRNPIHWDTALLRKKTANCGQRNGFSILFFARPHQLAEWTVFPVLLQIIASLHCAKNNLNLCTKSDPVTSGADASVYMCIVQCTYCTYSYIGIFFFRKFRISGPNTVKLASAPTVTG